MFDVVCWLIQREWNADELQGTYRQPSLAKMLVTILRPPSTIERPQSTNSFVEAQNTTQQCTALYWS